MQIKKKRKWMREVAKCQRNPIQRNGIISEFRQHGLHNTDIKEIIILFSQEMVPS